jgi:hypothetical protein
MGVRKSLRLVNSEIEPSSRHALAPEPSIPSARVLELSSRHSLEIAEGGTSFSVRALDGRIELHVRITPDGPVLCFNAAAIEIAKTRTLKLDVDQLELCARERIHLQSHGNLTQTIAGNFVSHCEGRQELHASELAATSHRGPMSLESSEDVAINGERVLINC